MKLDVRQYLQSKAKAHPKTVILPESGEERILHAARQVLDLGIGHPILVGNPNEVRPFAASLGVSLDGIAIVDHTEETAVDELIERFLKINTIFGAKTLKRMLRVPLNFALMKEAVGDVDCTVAGLNITTGDVILAAQTFLGMQPGICTVSSIGIWSIPGFEGIDGNVLIHADCAVCPAPTPSELADIAITTADNTRTLLDLEPRVAFLSFSTKGSAQHEKVDQVIEALRIARERRPDLLMDGEFQLDSAILPSVAARKVKEPSPVAGRANILIFPDLNAGNIGVKLVQIFAKAEAFGPLLQGFALPVSDLSRGHTVTEIVGAIMNAIVLAHKNEGEPA